MAKLTWMAHSNLWFCSQKVTEKNNPGRNNGPAWAPCYIFQVSDKYSQGLSSLSFLSFSLQLQILLVKSNPPVFVRERAKALLLYAFPGVTWALCYWLAVRDVKEKKIHSKGPIFLGWVNWNTCFLKWAAFQCLQGNSEHKYQMKSFRAIWKQMGDSSCH